MIDDNPREYPGGQTEGNFDVLPEAAIPNQPQEQYGLGKTAAAFIAKDNFVTNTVWKVSDMALTAYEQLTYDGIDGYDPLSDDERSKYDSKYWPVISTAKSPWQAGRKVLKAQQEEYYDNIIEHGSGWGLLLGGAYNTATSPLMAWPVASAITKPKFLTSVVKNTAAAIPGILTGTALGEAGLYWAQETRGVEEAAANVAAGTIAGSFMAGLGGGLRVLGPKLYQRLVRENVEGADIKTLINKEGDVIGVDIQDGGSVGAGKSEEVLIDDLKLLTPKGALGAPTKGLFWLGARVFRNPTIQGLLSKSKTTVSFINDAFEHNYEIAGGPKNFDKAPSLQSLIKDYQARGITYQSDFIDAYYKQLGLDEKGSKIGNAVKSTFAKDKNAYMTMDDFSKRVSIAITEGGIDSDYPVVAEMAKRTIDKVIGPSTDKLVELDLVPPNLTPFGASQYLRRVYDKEYITATRPQRVTDLVEAFEETNVRIREATKELDARRAELRNLETNKAPEADIKAAHEKVVQEEARIKAGIDKGLYSPDMLVGDIKAGTAEFRKILNGAELRLAAESTIDNILHMSPDQIAQQMMGVFRNGTGATTLLTPRALLLQDKFLYEKGFLNSDLRLTIPNYLLRMGRIIETEKYFKAKGYDGVGSKLDFLGEGISKDYQALREALDAKLAKKIARARSPEKIKKLEAQAEKDRMRLDKEMKRDILLAKRTLSRIQGEVPMDNSELLRTSRFLNNWAYSSQLGLMVLACLQDAVSPLVRVGARYISDGVIPYARGLISKGGNKRFRQSMADMAIGCDTEQSFYRLKFESDLQAELPMNYVERQSRNVANAMGILNLSNSWTDTWRRIAGTASESNMFRRVQSFSKGKLKGSQLAQFKVLRMDNEGLNKRIIEQYNKYGKKIRGAYTMNLHLWDDLEAAQRYRMAVRQELDSVIFSGKDISSYPSFVEFHGAANSFLMYLGWAFHASSNYLLPMMQRLDFNKVVGIAAMITVASQQDILRKLAKGEELSDEDLEPETMLKKGILNSGVLGIQGEAFNRINAAFNIFPELKVDRFQDKGKLELISGAPYSFLNFIGTATALGITGEWNKSDLKFLKRNTPLAEALGSKKLGNDWIDSLDIPETRSKAHKEQLREKGIVEPKKPKKRRKEK